MPSSSPLPLVAAALLGALAGAVAGALVAAPHDAPAALASARPAGPGDPPGGAPSTERVELLLSTLVDEVRALRLALASQRTTAEPEASPEPAPEGDPTAELLEAITALTRTLQHGGEGALGLGGRGLPVLDVPPRAARFDVLRDISGQDAQERARPFLLWNYQQVLDRFGPPTVVWPGGRWMYEQPGSAGQVELKFEDGLLIGIY